MLWAAREDWADTAILTASHCRIPPGETVKPPLHLHGEFMAILPYLKETQSLL